MRFGERPAVAANTCSTPAGSWAPSTVAICSSVAPSRRPIGVEPPSGRAASLPATCVLTARAGRSPPERPETPPPRRTPRARRARRDAAESPVTSWTSRRGVPLVLSRRRLPPSGCPAAYWSCLPTVNRCAGTAAAGLGPSAVVFRTFRGATGCWFGRGRRAGRLRLEDPPDREVIGSPGLLSSLREGVEGRSRKRARRGLPRYSFGRWRAEFGQHKMRDRREKGRSKQGGFAEHQGNREKGLRRGLEGPDGESGVRVAQAVEVRYHCADRAANRCR